MISGGGDILLNAASTTTATGSYYTDIDADGNTRNINSGTGDITFLVEGCKFDYGGGNLNITCTGIFTIAPANEANNWTSILVWNEATGTGTNNLQGLIFSSFQSLGGVSIGIYQDPSYTPITDPSLNDISIRSDIVIPGPIRVHGKNVDFQKGNLWSRPAGTGSYNQSHDIYVSASEELLFARGLTNFSLNAGSGNITLESSKIAFDGSLVTSGAKWTTVKSTGVLTIKPYGSSTSFNTAMLGGGDGVNGTQFNWDGTLNGTTWEWAAGASVVKYLRIEDFSSLGGLILQNQNTTTNMVVFNPISISGGITLYGGTITLNENLSSSGGGAISLYGNGLTIAANKTISSAGQLIVSGQSTTTTIGLAGGTGTLSLPLSYFTTNFTNGFSNINIGADNHVGNISIGGFSLVDPMTIKTSGIVSLAGNVTLGDNDLTIGSNVQSISGVPAFSFRTNGIGKLKRSISQNASFTFPVGVVLTQPMNVPVYLPITITNKSVLREYYVTVSNGVFANGSASSSGTVPAFSNTTPRIEMTWNIGNDANPQAVASPGIDLSFSWPANTLSATTANMTQPRLYHHNGSLWTQLTGTPTFDLAAGTFSYTGYVGSFSPFTIGEQNSTLPVTWHSFTATEQGSGALLQWSTASEQNTKDFVVEYSTNAMSWSPIGTIPAAGNSSSHQFYSYMHKDPVKGQPVHFYRIQQRDLDGKFSYSKIVRLQMSGAETGMLIYPNPARDVINIYLSQPQELRIISITGAEVWHNKLPAGNHQIEVGHLLRGMYIVATPTQQQKVVLD